MTARLAYWLADDLSGLDGRAGLIGGLEAQAERDGIELLGEVAARVGAEGACQVFGPMLGSTWAEYRLVLPDRALSEPRFTGEPADRPDLLAMFEGAGFGICARYESRRAFLPASRPGAGRLAERIERSGVAVRLPEPEEWPDLPPRLYEFSKRAFADNLYYRPVPFEFFAPAQTGCGRGRPHLLLAERAGDLLGFAYAYADEAGPHRLVAKTLAVAPTARALGLGAHLADRLHELAPTLGFSEVIHALMHADNTSVRHSERFGGSLLRRYALFGRSLR